jgi:hypothetical protein
LIQLISVMETMSHTGYHPSYDNHQHDDICDGQDKEQRYAEMNKIPLCQPNELSHEQLLAYFNATVHLYRNMDGLPSPYWQGAPKAYTDLRSMPGCLPPPLDQQQRYQLASHQVMSSSNMPLARQHISAPHFSTNEQIPSMIAFQPSVGVPSTLQSIMTNPTSTSTPAKRGRADVSGNSETQAQPHINPSVQRTSGFYSNNTPSKRRRGNTQHGQVPPPQTGQSPNLRGPVMPEGSALPFTRDNQAQQQKVSTAAQRFATSRYPFSPFTIILEQTVRDKTVVDELVMHASKAYNFELKIVGYRRARSENTECRVLLFVENSESFAFLYDKSHWPPALIGHAYETRTPSIPPQLSLVLPSVSLQIDWEEFVEEMKEKYSEVVHVIRFKNKAQIPVRAVKLEFSSPKARDTVFQEGAVSVMHMKFKVVEYFALANVLLCSNCHAIGHFRNNCPQKGEATCKVCGDKCADLKAHNCSGVSKCVHCAGQHNSNDTKCLVLKDYRAALTRNLLANSTERAPGPVIPRPPITSGDPQDRPAYSTVAQMTPLNYDDVFSKKLDQIMDKVEMESNKTRESVEEFKEEFKEKVLALVGRVSVVEQTVESLQKEFDAFSKTVNNRMTNLFKAMLDPSVFREAPWRTYWQEQLELMEKNHGLRNIQEK